MIRTLLLILCMAGLTASTACAQNDVANQAAPTTTIPAAGLLATWTTDNCEVMGFSNEAADEAHADITFLSGNAATIELYARVKTTSQGQDIYFKIKMMMQGTYVKNSRTLSLCMEKKNSKCEILDIDLKLDEATLAIAAEKGYTQEDLKEMMKGMVDPAEINANLPEFKEQFYIKSLTPSHLELISISGVAMGLDRKG